MNEEKIRVRCPACRIEFQMADEPQALYTIPLHKGPIMNPCTGSGLTTAYHAHGVPDYGDVVALLEAEAEVAAIEEATPDVAPALSIPRAPKLRLSMSPRVVPLRDDVQPF